MENCNVKLFQHQLDALERVKGRNRVAFFHDMGLGKTYTGAEKMMQFGLFTNLIVCQKSKIQDWLDHFSTNYSGVEVYNLTDKKQLNKFIFHDGGSMIVGVINYELIWRRKQFLELKDFTLILDESSLIQNEKANRSKFILKMNPTNVVLLSGTPVSGKYENLYSQIHLLGWSISQDTYNKQYINWKKIDVGGFIHKIVDQDNPYKNVDRLKSKMREHGCDFLKTEECFDLPEQNFIPVNCGSSKEYRRFKKDSIITILDDDKEIELIGDTTLTKMLYLRMLCGQYNQSKLEAFKDLVESTNDRLIVFYNFKEEVKKLIHIVNELDRPWAIISGDAKNLAAYDNYDNSITFVQYQAGSMGLNLQKANKIIYFTLPLLSEHFEQSKKRIHRIGQTNTCFYYLMICKGTIEEDILQLLEMRKDYTDELFREKEG